MVALNAVSKSVIGAEPAWQVPLADFTVFAEKRHRHVLVIPVINEGQRILDQLAAIAEFGPDMDIVIADGGSTDGSLESEHLKTVGVRALLVKRGPGKLSAQLRMGYAWALREGYDGVITMDGNGKDGVEALPLFSKALEEGADYVQGSRYIKGGVAENTPLDRKIGGRLIHAPILSLAAGRWYTDTTNGFRAYSAAYLRDPRVAPFRDIFDKYNLLFYLTARANQLGYTCRDIPVRRIYPAGTKTPTKINGLSGRMQIIGELLRSAFGGCLPAHVLPFANGTARTAPHSNLGSAVPVFAMLVTAVMFVVLTRAVPILDMNDPWFDEAMLIANFPLDSLSALFRPLPLFDQASPLGYITLLQVLASLSQDPPVAWFVLLSGVASLIAAGFIIASLRRLSTGPVVPFAVVVASCSPFIVEYSLQIKPYVFEYLSTAILLYASIRLLEKYSRRNTLIFFGGCVFAVFFSFTAPIIIGAFGLGILAHRWIGYSRVNSPNGMFGIVAVLTLSAAIFLAYYLGYTRPVTENLFSAFAYLYEARLLTFPPLTGSELKLWVNLPNIVQAQLDFLPNFVYSDYPTAKLDLIVPIVFWAVFAVGMVSLASRFFFLPASFVFAVILIYGLSLAGLLPIAYSHHFTFIVPITGIIFAFGVAGSLSWIFRWAVPQRAKSIVAVCMALAVFGVGVSGLLRSSSLDRQEISPLIDYILSQQGDDAPVWVYFGAQPAMRVLAPDSLVQIGLIEHESKDTGWLADVQDLYIVEMKENYYKEFRETISGLSSLWLIFSHTWIEPRLERYRSIAEEEIGDCREVMIATGTRLWRCG